MCSLSPRAICDSPIRPGGGHDPDTSVECMRMHVQGTAPPAWQLGEARPHQCCASDGPRRATSLQQRTARQALPVVLARAIGAVPCRLGALLEVADGHVAWRGKCSTVQCSAVRCSTVQCSSSAVRTRYGGWSHSLVCWRLRSQHPRPGRTATPRDSAARPACAAWRSQEPGGRLPGAQGRELRRCQGGPSSAVDLRRPPYSSMAVLDWSAFERPYSAQMFSSIGCTLAV